MTELNLKFHYQLVKHRANGRIEFIVHEAFSTDKDELYMVVPSPVYISGDTIPEIEDGADTIKQDIKDYGCVNAEDILDKFERYLEYTGLPVINPDYTTENILEEESDEEPDFDFDMRDRTGKVIDLVDFIKKNK